MEKTVENTLHSMSSVNRPQMKFILVLMTALTVFQGKATFRNLSRYSYYCEKTFSRWYKKKFDFVELNSQLLIHELPEEAEKVAAIDASFMKKSGQNTEGLGWFYHSQADKAEHGLEMSLICIVDIKANTAYALDAKQTIDTKDEKTTRVDLYGRQVKELSDEIKRHGARHVVGDAYYSKVKFIDSVRETGLHLIGKLRIDANMKWLYEGEYSGFGRPKKYDGKVSINDELNRFYFHGELDNGDEVYSKIVHMPQFKRHVKVVLLRSEIDNKVGTALLFSTDLDLDVMKIISYYKARFQIEFLFREAKQYTGLLDCQSCSKEAIHTQINASLSALNILKLEDRRNKKTDSASVISIASWRRKKFNQNFMEILFDKLGLSRSCNKVEDVYQELSRYGEIAA